MWVSYFMAALTAPSQRATSNSICCPFLTVCGHTWELITSRTCPPLMVTHASLWSLIVFPNHVVCLPPNASLPWWKWHNSSLTIPSDTLGSARTLYQALPYCHGLARLWRHPVKTFTLTQILSRHSCSSPGSYQDASLRLLLKHTSHLTSLSSLVCAKWTSYLFSWSPVTNSSEYVQCIPPACIACDYLQRAFPSFVFSVYACKDCLDI